MSVVVIFTCVLLAARRLFLSIHLLCRYRFLVRNHIMFVVQIWLYRLIKWNRLWFFVSFSCYIIVCVILSSDCSMSFCCGLKICRVKSLFFYAISSMGCLINFPFDLALSHKHNFTNMAFILTFNHTINMHLTIVFNIIPLVSVSISGFVGTYCERIIREIWCARIRIMHAYSTVTPIHVHFVQLFIYTISCLPYNIQRFSGNDCLT